MKQPLVRAAKRADEIFGRLEQGLLVGLVCLLFGFSLAQVVLRNFLGTGLVWSDDLLRHGVLWLSFLGATRATAEGRHINIDLLPRVFPAWGRFLAGLASSLFSFLVTLTLAWASCNFVLRERQGGGIAFAGIPYWWVELIFPVCFALMGLRFGAAFINGLAKGPGKMDS